MVTNAYSECKRLVGDIRAAVTYLRALPPEAITPPSLTKQQ